MVIADVSSGISGESKGGVSVRVVDASESKTLAENLRDEGGLTEEARVSDEYKALHVESSNENVINKTRKGSYQSTRQDIRTMVDASGSITRSQSHKFDSWGVLNMAGNVLGEKFHMGDEVEEMNTSENALETNMVEVAAVINSENGREATVVEMDDADNSANGLGANVVWWEEDMETSNSVHEAYVFKTEVLETSKNECEGNVAADMDKRQRAIDVSLSLGKTDVEQFVVDNDLDELILYTGEADRFIVGNESNELIQDGLVEGAGLKGDQNLLSTELVLRGTELNADQETLSNYLVPHGMLRNYEVNEVEGGVCLIPKTRGEHQMTEKEGEYYVTDLVWGKVRSHPWWPGQIFLPTAASDKAKKCFKKPSYLIAFFGDQSFAWNEGSNIKPFHVYFSQMEKQSRSDSFGHAVSCALDEVARRAELGLSCQCLSEEVRGMLEIQVVFNAGILEDKNKVDGGGNLLCLASFSPRNLVHFLESLAASPQTETDRLEFTIKKAQLLAFSRWKGHYELQDFEQCVGLLEYDTDVTDDFSSKKRKPTAGDGSLKKHRQLFGDKEFPTLKEEYISTLIFSGSSILPNTDENILRTALRPVSAGKNIKSLNSNPRVKRQKTVLPSTQIGDARKNREESEMVEIIPSEIPTPDVILSKLTFAAKVPIQEFRVMVLEVYFLHEFRNSICLEKSSSLNDEMESVKPKGKQPANSDTAENTFVFEGTNDSYWTDRIIQSSIQESSNTAQVEEPTPKINETLSMHLGSEKMPPDEYQPTALILNFSSLESVPSITNLNEIFGRYGPLDESETRILRKSKRVKMIFRKRVDAETAFSSPGKYSIFGPSLVSYKLHYDPQPRKACGSSKRAKKDNGSAKVNA